MRDPVVDPDGNTYERSAIEDWLARNATSPIVSDRFLCIHEGLPHH